MKVKKEEMEKVEGKEEEEDKEVTVGGKEGSRTMRRRW